METLRPYSLLCELTYSCPLHCPYCSNPVDFVRYKEELNTEEWERILGESAQLGVVQVNFSGGEPLLRADLPQIVKKARNLGMYTNLSTGGTLLNEKLAQDLSAAGLDSLQISIQHSDASGSDLITGYSNSLEKKKMAALLAKNAGFSLTINVVLHRQNIEHIESIINLAEELGAERLELANTQFNGWALKNLSWLLPTSSQVERAGSVVEAARFRLKDKMEILYVLSDYYGQFPKSCMHGWGSTFITVTADGTVLPCQAAREIHGLTFENVRNQSLEKIWFESKSFCMFRGTDWLPEPCQSCPRKTIDFGGCRCQSFLLTGDAAVTDPACSLSPYHFVIDQAITEVKTTNKERPIYRNERESEKMVESIRATKSAKDLKEELSNTKTVGR